MALIDISQEIGDDAFNHFVHILGLPVPEFCLAGSSIPPTTNSAVSFRKLPSLRSICDKDRRPMFKRSTNMSATTVHCHNKMLSSVLMICTNNLVAETTHADNGDAMQANALDYWIMRDRSANGEETSIKPAK